MFTDAVISRSCPHAIPASEWAQLTWPPSSSRRPDCWFTRLYGGRSCRHLINCANPVVGGRSGPIHVGDTTVRGGRASPIGQPYPTLRSQESSCGCSATDRAASDPSGCAIWPYGPARSERESPEPEARPFFSRSPCIDGNRHRRNELRAPGGLLGEASLR